MKLIQYLNDLLWGPFGSVIILSGGIYLLARLKFFYILHPAKTAKTVSQSGGLTAMLSALGGSIGVGNIVGVGVALSLGGAGAVFWMWVCALITAVLKYSEIYLSVKYKKRENGGPMYYLQLCNIPFLSEIFCLLCIASSFGIGCSVQSNAASLAASELSVSSGFVGFVLALFCLITFLGGGNGLQKVCKILVPVMSILYICGCIAIIILNIGLVPNMLFGIFKSAFNFKSAFGGIGASLFMRGLKQGMSKGIFSAESGMGSSAIMYSFGKTTKAEKQGVWGIFEVFIDTVVMCSISAFAILVSDKENIFTAFTSSFGKIGGYFTFLSVLCFAYTSICCWNFYGASCVRFLLKRKWALFLYNALFVLCIYVGAVANTEGVWFVSDLCNAFMLFLNFFGILKLSDRIRSPL